MLLEIEKIKNRKFFKDRNWSDYELNILNKMLNEFNLTNGFIRNISYFKDNNLKHWFQRYKRLGKFPKKQTKYNYLMRLGKINCIKEWSKHIDRLKYINSKQYFIDKYGAELGPIKYNRQFDNNSFKNSEVQRKNSLKSLEKRRANPELYNDIMPNQIGYWLKQGFTEDESKELVSERQRTFTLEKCIKKYGETEGKRIFDERQMKWQNTLNSKSQEEKDVINRRKNPCIKRIGESKEDFRIRLAGIGTNIIFDNDDLIEYINNSLSNVKWKYLNKEEFLKQLPYIGNSDIDVNKYLDEIGFIFPEKNLIKKNKKGYTYLKIDEGVLRSFFEIEFYEGLKERNIKFKLDRVYNNSSLKYDFYLVDYDIYIEIAGGMYDEGYTNKMIYKNTTFGAFIVEPSDIQDFLKRIDNNEFTKINSNL